VLPELRLIHGLSDYPNEVVSFTDGTWLAAYMEPEWRYSELTPGEPATMHYFGITPVPQP
jgi:hypothetical protein